MALVSAKNTLGDLLLVEINPAWTRQISPITGTKLPMGTVLAKLADKYQRIDFAGAGGAEVAAAVLAEDIDASAGDVRGVIIKRGAVVASDALVWPSGVTAPQKTGALAQLEALGVVPVATL